MTAPQPEKRDPRADLLAHLGRLKPGSENTVLIVEDEMASLASIDLQALLNQVARTNRRPMSASKLHPFDLAAELRAASAAQQPLRDRIAGNTQLSAATWELLAPKTTPAALLPYDFEGSA